MAVLMSTSLSLDDMGWWFRLRIKLRIELRIKFWIRI